MGVEVELSVVDHLVVLEDDTVGSHCYCIFFFSLHLIIFAARIALYINVPDIINNLIQ